MAHVHVDKALNDEDFVDAVSVDAIVVDARSKRYCCRCRIYRRSSRCKLEGEGVRQQIIVRLGWQLLLSYD